MRTRAEMIGEAKYKLIELDRTSGERTVGERRADAARIARECGLVVRNCGSERYDPVLDQVMS